jgi:hypothetical protein
MTSEKKPEEKSKADVKNLATEQKQTHKNSFYVHYENLKNQVYRQLSGAGTPGLFWPRYYFNWFYSNEQVNYMNLVKRQRLGLKISDEEIVEYNKIRENITPKSRYVVGKSTARTLDGTPYDSLVLRRENHFFYKCVGLGFFYYYYLQLSKYWFVIAFAPYLLINYYDRKFIPVEEYGNFYNYVEERRNATIFYAANKNKIDEKIKANPEFSAVVNELNRSHKSFEEAMGDVYNQYLVSAQNESI